MLLDRYLADTLGETNNSGIKERRGNMRPWSGRRLVTILLALAVAGGTVACGGDTKTARESEGIANTTPRAINELPQEIQRLAVVIADGKFDHDRYAMQPGAMRLLVTTRGGPYTFMIDPLVTPRELPANATTEIGFTAPEPGDYTMKLTGPAEATATLNVRPIGSR